MGKEGSKKELRMSQQPFEPQHSNRILTRIYEGMTVYDRAGDKIGTVEDVYLGGMSEEADKRGGGPETAPSPGRGEGSLSEDLAKAIFPSDQLPETLRQRLLRHGFIRLDSTGLFAADRYVMADQIADVSEDRVTLRVTRDELIKR
jgi:PRC-barrel domain